MINNKGGIDSQLINDELIRHSNNHQDWLDYQVENEDSISAFDKPNDSVIKEEPKSSEENSNLLDGP